MVFPKDQPKGSLQIELSTCEKCQVHKGACKCSLLLPLKKKLHRDLKSQNLLLGANGELTMADFKLAIHVYFKRRTICLTPARKHKRTASMTTINKMDRPVSELQTIGVLCKLSLRKDRITTQGNTASNELKFLWTAAVSVNCSSSVNYLECQSLWTVQ